MSKEKEVLAFSGHRSRSILSSSGKRYRGRKLRLLVRDTLERWGPEHHGKPSKDSIHIRVGGALGCDTLVMHCCHELGISYDVVLPFPLKIFTSRWPEPDKLLLLKLIGFANRTEVVGHFFHKGLYAERNMVIMHPAKELLVVWDGRKMGGTYSSLSYWFRIHQGRKPTYNILEQRPMNWADL